MKPQKITLVIHKGCTDCEKTCIFNKPCTTKEKNSQSRINKYGCNSSKEIL